MEEFVQKNLEELAQLISSADVLAVGLSRITQRLLVDFRHDHEEAPMVKVVDPVTSVEERVRELRRTRPRFPNPERFTFFVWPKSVTAFKDMGLWEMIIARCLTSGHSGVEEMCQRAFEELQTIERREVLEAISGDKYKSLWERSKS